MTALSDTIGDWNCTSIGSGGNSRFSHMAGFTLCEGLNYVEKGRHRGDKEVGDNKEDSGNDEMPKGKRANETRRRTKMVMATKNQKPAKKVAPKKVAAKKPAISISCFFL